MEEMSIGFVFDYIQDYLELLNPSKKSKVRKATQADINMLKGH